MLYPVIDAEIRPKGSLSVLSKSEVNKLFDSSNSGLYNIFHNCALAVLNTGSDIDDGSRLLECYPDFEIKVIQEHRGVLLKLKNAPSHAFVDGKIIRGIGEHLFAVLRDILYISDEITTNPKFNNNTSEGITNIVFNVLRNANILCPTTNPNMVICWGGHSINSEEYDYSKQVGYELSLRGMDITTGCGPGAMRGPMKGATIGHSKQRVIGRYLGITEPGIISSEAPNAICNNLVILPDIEKRLEAFVRVAHGIIVFPGGPGTSEEILYILGILLHPDNKNIPFPLILTGPESSREYFSKINEFIIRTLGVHVTKFYKIIIDSPKVVAETMQKEIKIVKKFRRKTGDSYYFNWLLKIDIAFQQPFKPTHENMKTLLLQKNLPTHILASNLRKVFSGIVAGNVKEEYVKRINQKGNFEISGDREIMELMDNLLSFYSINNRMKIPSSKNYVPCYKIIK
ncbi:MAG: nucleotide 5'-monophosphate nucleosidase PpnN [Bacilli bacterium]|nr:nucleotide 5'-monophosphate nucleosidase PpnN [Bacilli bacterium]